MILQALLPAMKKTLAASVAGYHPNNPLLAVLFGTPNSAAGVRVDHDTAQNYSAVWCATRIISEGIAQLPLVLYVGDEHEKRRAKSHPLYALIHDGPSREMDSFCFRDFMTACAVNYGNAYAEIQRVGSRVVAIYPIHASRVRPSRSYIEPSNGERVYLVDNDNGTSTPLYASDMLHIRGPLIGKSVVFGEGAIHRAIESIGLAMAMETFGSTFFANGARPAAILRHKDTLSLDAQRNLRDTWQKIHGSVEKSHNIAILEEGMELEPWGMEPEKSQFIEGREFQLTEIARWYRVPPHMLADLRRSTFSNIETQDLDLVRHSLMPWLVRWESALTQQLLSDGDRKSGHFVRFNVNAMLRGDTSARGQFYREMSATGAFSVNEIRELEDMNPVDGGDAHFINAAGVPLEMAADGGHLASAALSACSDALAKLNDAASSVKASSDTLRAAHGAHLESERLISELVMRHERDFDAGLQQVKLAGRSMLAECVCRMLQKEIAASRRAAKEPARLFAWMDEFYAKHEVQLAEALAPVCRVLALVGLHVQPMALASMHCARSRAALLEASGMVHGGELLNLVERITEQWRRDVPVWFESQLSSNSPDVMGGGHECRYDDSN